MPKLIDETGNKYGRWIVIEYAGHSNWLCRCECGTEKYVGGYNLRSGQSRSCGCLHKDIVSELVKKNEIGNRYGKLAVIQEADPPKESEWHSRRIWWLCKCECGRTKVASGIDLRRGRVKSCGCLLSRALPRGQAAFNRLYSSYKTAATRRGYKWELTKEKFRHITQQKCYYCRAEPSQLADTRGTANGNYIYNGIDRVDNEKGYIIDNVVSCCGVCNWAKLDRTLDEFTQWINSVYDTLRKRENSNGT